MRYSLCLTGTANSSAKMSSLVNKFIPKNLTQKVRAAVLFRPNDPVNLVQTPPQFEQNVGVESIKGYRYPSPGSQERPNIPTRSSVDQYYDVKFYSRDPRNLPKNEFVFINSASNPLEISSLRNKDGSPGQKNPAVLRYDPSGLRSTMTANWNSLEAAVAAHTPNHFPDPVWVNDIDALNDESEKKGLPYRLGRRYRAESTTPITVVW